MSDMARARLCRVRKLHRSSLGSRLNRRDARSLASVAAFFVNAKKAISVGRVPFSKAVSTMFNKVVVFPVPGGPKILNILFFFF